MTEVNVSVVGLGAMGQGMAQSLVRAGLRVAGFDRAPEQVARLVALGGQAGNAGAVAITDILVIVVLTGAQTLDVLFGAGGWAARLRQGAVVMSCATMAPDDARELAAGCEKAGLLFLDSPISGGAAKSADGRLSIMASGSTEAFEAAAPALEAMAETVHDLGPEVGAGSAMKSVNQLLAGTHIAAMGEALSFAAAQGLDLAQVVQVVNASAGASFMFSNRAPHVVDADYTPRSAVDIWLKDLGIIRDIAASCGAQTPLTQTALAQFRAASQAGLGQEDDAAITKLYARAAGVALPGDA